MSAFVTAMDIHTPTQIGENGTSEYTWSNNLQERILQLYFQLTRTGSNSQHQHLITQYKNILDEIFKSENKECKAVAYKLIAQTRDIISGKGEYNLSYGLLTELANHSYDHAIDLAKNALRLFVLSPENAPSVHPYGSWKDIKYFCNYWKSCDLPLNHPIITYAIDLVVNQLKQDQNSDHPSLLARWVAREKSKKFGWLTKHIATAYYKEWLNNGNDQQAIKKCLTHFRKLLSSLNKKLNTVQINQCDKAWSKIDFDKEVTSITLRKQHRAFQYIDRKGHYRGEEKDRYSCAENYHNFIDRARNGISTVKGKRVGINNLVKDAIDLLNNNSLNSYSIKEYNAEKDLINLQWKDNSSSNSNIGPMIAMVDTSGSMDGNPLYAAIGLGCRVAEKSILGKRILTFSSIPSWINLEGCANLFDMVERIHGANWSMNTNFESALNLILDACIEKKLSQKEVSNLVLAIFSDMQIDHADRYAKDTMFERMKKKFAESGIKAIGKPYSLPHILFWNLRSTKGFPTLSTSENSSMMSGFNPALLEQFATRGVEALKELTPWSILLENMKNERYNPMEEALDEYDNWVNVPMVNDLW